MEPWALCPRGRGPAAFWLQDLGALRERELGWFPQESGMSVEGDQGAQCWRVLGGCRGSSFTGPLPVCAPSWDVPPTPRGTGGAQGRDGGENGVPVPEGRLNPPRPGAQGMGTVCRPSPGTRTPRQLAEDCPPCSQPLPQDRPPVAGSYIRGHDLDSFEGRVCG